MSLNYMTDQIAVMGNLATHPDNQSTPYKGFFVAYNNGTTWVCKAGHCFNQVRKTPSVLHSNTETDRFTKTGSGPR
eukprot:COSAG06_NODE_13591_length_1241_cov_1.538529_2_plen_76_part_00